MARLRFSFTVDTTALMVARLLDDRRTPATFETEPTVVGVLGDRALVPGFDLVKVRKERPPREFVLGEMIDGAPRLTTYVETPMDLCAPGVIALGNMPVRVIHGKGNRVHVHVPKGYTLIPTFSVAKCPEGRTRDRHFLVGDIWRGQLWLHSVIEQLKPPPERRRRVPLLERTP